MKGESTRVFVSRPLNPSIDEATKKLTVDNSFNNEFNTVVFNPVKPELWEETAPNTSLTLLR